MADGGASTDSFAAAKANLRDTIKWLATTLAALGAAVLAGVSLSGITALSGSRLQWALVAGAAGMACILLAVALLLRLLTSQTFYLGQLEGDDDLKARLAPNAADILPLEIASIDELLDVRKAAMAAVRARPLGTPAPPDAVATLNDLAGYAGLLTNLGSLERLRRDFERRTPWLFLLAILAIVSLGAFAVLVGTEKPEDKLPSQGSVQIIPTKGWQNIGAALAQACGDSAPVRAEMVRVQGANWVELRLLGPADCAGVLISLPASIVVVPTQTTP